VRPLTFVVPSRLPVLGTQLPAVLPPGLQPGSRAARNVPTPSFFGSLGLSEAGAWAHVAAPPWDTPMLVARQAPLYSNYRVASSLRAHSKTRIHVETRETLSTKPRRWRGIYTSGLSALSPPPFQASHSVPTRTNTPQRSQKTSHPLPIPSWVTAETLVPGVDTQAHLPSLAMFKVTFLLHKKPGVGWILPLRANRAQVSVPDRPATPRQKTENHHDF